MEAIHQIGDIIDNISRFQIVIASAVEEQIRTTEDVNRTLDSTAAQTAQITSAITDVAESTDRTSTVVTKTRTAAEELAATSADLTTVITRFTI